jgi:UPF0755 protein
MFMRIIKILLLVFVVAVGTAGYVAWHKYETFVQTPVTLAQEDTTFTIQSGSSINRVANDLVAQGIIDDALMFKLLARIAQQDSQIKAGEFELSQGMTPMDVLQRFVSGKTLQYQLSIIEGRSFKEIVQKVKQSPDLIQTLKDEDYENIMEVLGSDAVHPEGWFYPDTYSFPRNTTDLEFLQRAHQQMKDFVQQEWEKHEPNEHITTPYDVLILASIVEKETGVPEERPLIAGVFLNRLEKGMLLQTDPTVIYGMGDNYDGNIRKSDLKRDTPYNTYTRKGLTPTPIATPSLDAIRAVLNPAETDAYFFVAKGGGAHHFSKTYAEHRKAVVKYLLNGNASRYKGDQ